MKLITVVILLLICASPYGDAQINLVKNPGFEQYWHCPNDWNETKFANYWSSLGDTIPVTIDSYSNYNCSPEYCNACAPFISTVSVPWEPDDFHYAHSGNGLFSVQMYNNKSNYDTGNINSAYREYLQGRLYKLLTKNATYCVSFYVVLTESSAFSINGIGAYFDDGKIDTATWCGWVQTSHTPQVYETAIISDTLNWTKVQGTFIANGTEKFITIGQFFDSAHTDKLPTNFDWAIGEDNNFASWYLVDDVSVIPIDAVADAGPDRVTTTAGDSVQIGDTTGYLPCQWYANGVLIDSNIAGLLVHPSVTTSYVMMLDVCGHITTDTAVVWVFPTGAESGVRGAGAGVLVYPNPATTFFTVAGAAGCEVGVYDMVGRRVFVGMAKDNKYVIDVGGVAKGVYFVEVVDGVTGERVVRRVQKI